MENIILYLEMGKKMTTYRMGTCCICKKFKALKDDICFVCQQKYNQFPDFSKLFGDTFKLFQKEDKNERN